MPLILRLISLLVLICVNSNGFSKNMVAWYPDSIGQRDRYELIIEMPKVYLSGILIMYRPSDGSVNASLINEFGISLIDFSYDEKKDRIKFLSLIDKLNKWYIKKILKNDLKKVLKGMKNGESEYLNAKRKIKYTFQLTDK